MTPRSVCPIADLMRLRRSLVLLACAGLILQARGGASAIQKNKPAILGQQGVTYRNTASGVAYVGSEVCSGCHRDISGQFVHTDMGRSMSRLTPSLLEKIPTSALVFEKSQNRYFQVYRQGVDLYQSEYEIGPEGREIFRENQKIEWIIGSGANGFTCLVRRGNYLFEAPLSFYTKIKDWGLSPGYEFRDYGFSRPILPGCIACHSGRPQPVKNGNGLFKDPPFRELAIGCENCHGPGQLHVEERMRGEPLVGDIDRSIVNPAKLPSWLADNICMYCHQGGHVRALQAGKDNFDFRPGTPLDETLAILMVPPKPESPPQSDLLEHNFSMVLSKCYRASGGRLGCLSCHDPHIQPSKQEAPAYYRKKCLTCHTDKSCAIPLQARLRKTPPDDCTGCHMPKRDVKIIAHSALTNHRVVAEEEEPFPDTTFHLTTPALPDLVHLNAVPGKENVPPQPLTLLEAYGQLANTRREYLQPYMSVLNQLAKTEPNDLVVLQAQARAVLQDGNPDGTTRAIRFLTRAIESGSTSSDDFQLLATLLAHSGRVNEAIGVLRQAIGVVPYDVQLYKLLAESYLAIDRREDAIQAVREALRFFPQDPATRALLKKTEGRAGKN